MTDRPLCDEVRDLLPELAAGVADGDDRARALAHLAGCSACRRELDEMTGAVDRLVLLAPEHEPSPGFESAVLAAMGPVRASRRRPGAFALAAAASVLVAAVAAGGVWWHTADDRQLAAQYRRTLAVADGRYLAAAEVSTVAEPSVGHAFLYAGGPSWLFLTLESAPSSGRYQVQLVTTDRRTIDIGWCDVSSGRGSWGRTIDVPMRDIRRIQLLQAGVPAMSATFD
jgi:hypothetical protein